jgi:hypothetical protein
VKNIERLNFVFMVSAEGRVFNSWLQQHGANPRNLRLGKCREMPSQRPPQAIVMRQRARSFYPFISANNLVNSTFQVGQRRWVNRLRGTILATIVVGY